MNVHIDELLNSLEPHFAIGRPIVSEGGKSYYALSAKGACPRRPPPAAVR